MKKILVIILATITTSGCVIAIDDNKQLGFIEMIERYEDDKYNVVCWRYNTGYAGGLSCIPKEQLSTKGE